LFSLFALHHSVFARERVRAWVARTVPASLERSFYVWVASALFIAVCALWQPIGGVAWSVPPPAGWLLYGLLAIGVWLSVRSAGVIDVWELAGVRQVEGRQGARAGDRRARESGAHAAGVRHPTSVPDVTGAGTGGQFKTTGPYGIVRHPIYLGWFLMVFGVPQMTMTRLVFALVSCGYLLMAIPLEEATLRRTTAGEYQEYTRLVRWRILPGIY
jgi:protein-S-isoprenylcysteine O-methyltransferase Ste14